MRIERPSRVIAALLTSEVEAAEFVEHLFEAGFDLLGVGDIHFHGEACATGGFDFADKRGELLFVARGDCDFCAGLRQRQRGVAADALKTRR